MKKQRFLIVAMLLMLLGINSSVYASENMRTDNGFTYVELEDGTLSIQKYEGEEEEVLVPAAIDGKNVIVIDSDVFAENDSIKKVIVSDGIKIIKNRVFSGCDNLEYVEFPEEVTFFGASVFSNCTSLKELVLPEGIVSINEYLFKNCTSLERIVFPNSLNRICRNSFENCTSLLELDFSDTQLYYIEGDIFKNCTALKKVIFPETLGIMRGYTFQNCPNLEYVYLPGSITETATTFENCEKLKSAGPKGSGSNVEFGWETDLPEYAFANHRFLESVIIPEGVESIGENAFSGCWNLKSVIISGGLKKIEASAFGNCRALEEIHLPDTVTTLGKWVFRGCSNIKKFVIPAGLKELPYCAFCDCINLEEVSFEKAHIETINSCAFKGCDSLKQFVVPESVSAVYGSAFAECENLEKLVVPGTVKTFNGGLENCIKIESAGPMGSDADFEFGWVDKIPDNAFARSNNLKSIEIPEGITMVGKQAFYQCTSLTELIIPNSLEKIGEEAFVKCENLETIYFDGTLDDWKKLRSNSPDWKLEETIAQIYLLRFVNPFEDIKESDYYHDAVLWAYINEITLGMDSTHFVPNGSCTRGQAVAFLWRLYGNEKVYISNPFVDIKESDYYYDAVLWAYAYGITKGVDEAHFSPNSVLTRAQFVSLLWRTQGEEESNIHNQFVDVKRNDYFYNSVLWAYENGITSGVDATHFAPKDACNRGQVVTFLYRAFGENKTL